MGLTTIETSGTSQETEALYREHGTAVARLCHSLLRDRAEGEDATQQVFLSAHRALLNGAAPREPLAWLLAIARNECYARFRQRAAAPLAAFEALEGAVADASAHALRAGELDSVWDEVGRMPPTQRKAFLLREIRGLSYGQLADELSLSPPSVRSLLLRARTRLRQRLGDAAAGIGGVPWVQALFRLVAGGDGASPVPAAAKAAAIGVGALALAGGGGLVARHASRPTAQAGARHPAHTRANHVATAAAVRPSRVDEPSSSLDRSGHRDTGKRDRSGSRDGTGQISTSSGERSSGSGHEGSHDSTAAAAPTTDGHDGGTGSSSGPGPGVTTGVTSSSSGQDGSGSDGGSSTTTTATTTTSSDSSGSGGLPGTDGGTIDGSSSGHGG